MLQQCAACLSCCCPAACLARETDIERQREREWKGGAERSLKNVIISGRDYAAIYAPMRRTLECECLEPGKQWYGVWGGEGIGWDGEGINLSTLHCSQRGLSALRALLEVISAVDACNKFFSFFRFSPIQFVPFAPPSLAFYPPPCSFSLSSVSSLNNGIGL